MISAITDTDDRYDLRPSGWVEPQGDWGKGRVELVEIPTADETNDNIVAFWTPESLPEPAKMNFKYRLHFTRDENQLHRTMWRVKDTLRSAGDVKQSNWCVSRMVPLPTVDFVGKAMSKLPENTVAPQVSVGNNADVVEQSVRYNPVTKGWRLVLRLRVKDNKQPTEMRAALVSDKTLTETGAISYLPMNKSTYLPQSYVEALPLDAAARATLSASLQNAQAFHAIHNALGQDIAASERRTMRR